MKIAKVITTCFEKRAVREKTSISGYPPGLFSHSQKFENVFDIIKLIQLNIDCELSHKQAIEVDMIIVNNDIGDAVGNAYLHSINGMSLHNGSIKILTRENTGRSFGGYNHAFNTYRDLYSHYLFSEDDIIIWGEDYANYAIEYFNSVSNCGFVAFQGISKRYKNKSSQDAIHAHGGVGLSSYEVLKKVVDHHGNLPFVSDINRQSYDNIIEDGEIKFTNVITQLGYKLDELPLGVKYYDYGYDLIRKINIKKRYLNVYEAFMYESIKNIAKMKFFLKDN